MNKHNIIQVSLCHILQIVSIKLYSVIPFNRNPHNTESRQLIWNANKWTDFYTIQVPPKGISKEAISTRPLLTRYHNITIRRRRRKLII